MYAAAAGPYGCEVAPPPPSLPHHLQSGTHSTATCLYSALIHLHVLLSLCKLHWTQESLPASGVAGKANGPPPHSCRASLPVCLMHVGAGSRDTDGKVTGNAPHPHMRPASHQQPFRISIQRRETQGEVRHVLGFERVSMQQVRALIMCACWHGMHTCTACTT